MASFLSRIGRGSAKHAWTVILVWALLLGTIAFTSLSYGKKFDAEITIPGTEFQTVIDDLRTTVPDAAGSVGSVSFKTTDGQAFSPDQRQAISDVVKAWGDVDGVVTATDPFAVQDQLDTAPAQIADGQRQLAEGQAKIDASQKQLDDAKVQFEPGQKKLDDSKAQLDAGRQQLADSQQKLDDSKAQLDDGWAQLHASEPELAAGKAKLDEGKPQLDASAQQLAAAQAELDSGKQQLDASAAQLADAKAQLDAGPAQLAAAQQQLADSRSTLDAGEAQLAGSEQQLADSKATLDAGEQQYAAAAAQVEQLAAALGESDPQVQGAQAQLAQKRAELDAGQQQYQAGLAQYQEAKAQLDAGEQQYQAGMATYQQKQAELAGGQQRYDAGMQEYQAAQAKYDAGLQQFQQGQAQYDAAKAQYDAGLVTWQQGQAQYDAALAKLQDGQAQYDAGKAQFDEAKAKLDEGQKQYDEGKAEFDKGKASYDAGVQQLADAKKQLADNKAKLDLGVRQQKVTDGMRMVSEDGTTAISHVQFNEPTASITPATRQDVQRAAAGLADKGIETNYSGEFSFDLANIVGANEFLGLIPATIVLLVMLGSLVAAGLPVLSSLVGVGVGLLGAKLLTIWVPQTSVTPILALMLGLAVGIDYSLFILNRHREQIAKGMDVDDSIARAVGTSGNAVFFAGATVVVALLGLWITGIPFLGLMGTMAAITVLIAVLVALTFTPAMLHLLGQRVLGRKAREHILARMAKNDVDADAEDEADRRGEKQHASGWAGFVTGHPWIALAISVVLLGIIAIPAGQLRLGLPDASYDNHDTSAYKQYMTMSETFGPGETGVIVAAAKVDDAKAATLTDDAAITQLQYDIADSIKAVPGVKYVVPVATSPDKHTLVYQIVPTTGPSEQATAELVKQIRTDRVGWQANYGLDSLGLAGATVANLDMSDRLTHALPIYLLVVVGISLILLLLVFRSLLVPIIATLGFLLSLAASFGAVVAVYQWGWMAQFFGVNRAGPVLSFLPTIVIGMLFGLAMDYQMFLVSGMRESYAHGHTAHTAVKQGFAHGARVVAAAALIMSSVFAAFINASLTMIRPIGFALTFGVLFDAFVVRMTAMPAIMQLLGEKAWYLPEWMDKALVDLDVEGTKLEAPARALAA